MSRPMENNGSGMPSPYPPDIHRATDAFINTQADPPAEPMPTSIHTTIYMEPLWQKYSYKKWTNSETLSTLQNPKYTAYDVTTSNNDEQTIQCKVNSATNLPVEQNVDSQQLQDDHKSGVIELPLPQNRTPSTRPAQDKFMYGDNACALGEILEHDRHQGLAKGFSIISNRELGRKQNVMENLAELKDTVHILSEERDEVEGRCLEITLELDKESLQRLDCERTIKELNNKNEVLQQQLLHFKEISQSNLSIHETMKASNNDLEALVRKYANTIDQVKNEENNLEIKCASLECLAELNEMRIENLVKKFNKEVEAKFLKEKELCTLKESFSAKLSSNQKRHEDEMRKLQQKCLTERPGSFKGDMHNIENLEKRLRMKEDANAEALRQLQLGADIIVKLHKSLDQEMLKVALADKYLKLASNMKGKSQLELQMMQADLHESQHELKITMADLQKSQDALQMSQADLRESQDALQMTQADLRESQDALQMSQADLRESQDALHMTQADLRESQDALQMSQADLQESQDALQMTKADLRESQDALQRSQADLRESQDALHLTQTDLQESQNALHLTQTGLQESQNALQMSQAELKQSQDALQMSQADLKESTDALQMTQADLQESQDALQMNQIDLKKSQDALQMSQADLKESQDALQMSQTDHKESQDAIQMSQADLQESKYALHMSQADLQEIHDKYKQAFEKLNKKNADLMRDIDNLKNIDNLVHHSKDTATLYSDANHEELVEHEKKLLQQIYDMETKAKMENARWRQQQQCLEEYMKEVDEELMCQDEKLLEKDHLIDSLQAVLLEMDSEQEEIKSQTTL